MAETGAEQMDENALVKRASRKLMLHYKGLLEHFDVLDKTDASGVKQREPIRKAATNVMQMFTSCVGKSNVPFPDHWPKQGYGGSLVKLARRLESGEVTEAERNMLAPSNPRTFVSIVKTFVDTGTLPPETPAEKSRREQLEEDVRKAAEQTANANSGGPHSSRTSSGYSQYEQHARQGEEQRRQQEDAERQRREQQWQWQRQREDRARQQQYDQQQEQERQAREQQRQQQERQQQRAEQERQRHEREAADARKPENVFGRRIQGARQPSSLRTILRDLDQAFAGIAPDGSPLTREQIPSAALHKRLKEVDIPERGATIFAERIQRAATIDQLRAEFKEVITCGVFRDIQEERELSNIGQRVLGLTYPKAWEILNTQIEAATTSNQLKSIRRQAEEFLGGKLDQPKIKGRTMFGFLRRRLSELELSKLSREQRQLYAAGENLPNFRGPLSTKEQESIAGEENIVYQNPTDKYMSDMADAFKKAFQERGEEFEAAKGAPA